MGHCVLEEQSVADSIGGVKCRQYTGQGGGLGTEAEFLRTQQKQPALTCCHRHHSRGRLLSRGRTGPRSSVGLLRTSQVNQSQEGCQDSASPLAGARQWPCKLLPGEFSNGPVISSFYSLAPRALGEIAHVAILSGPVV